MLVRSVINLSVRLHVFFRLFKPLFASLLSSKIIFQLVQKWSHVNELTSYQAEYSLNVSEITRKFLLQTKPANQRLADNMLCEFNYGDKYFLLSCRATVLVLI